MSQAKFPECVQNLRRCHEDLVLGETLEELRGDTPDVLTKDVRKVLADCLEWLATVGLSEAERVIPWDLATLAAEALEAAAETASSDLWEEGDIVHMEDLARELREEASRTIRPADASRLGTSSDPQVQADRWNAAHAVGTAVQLRKDDGTLLKTKTRSEAWVLGGHTVVVKVDGIAGGYLLDRVTPSHGGSGGADGEA